MKALRENIFYVGEISDGQVDWEVEKLELRKLVDGFESIAEACLSDITPTSVVVRHEFMALE